MLCETGSLSTLNRKNMAGEVKEDGTRALLIKTEESFMIQSRPRKKDGVLVCSDYTRRLPEVTSEAKRFDETFIIDGEVCYFNAEGVSEFTPCQRRCSTQNPIKILALKRKYPVVHVAFDILELEGKNLRRTPYLQRKQVLQDLLINVRSGISYCEHFFNMSDLLDVTISKGGEGIIAKRVNSIYRDGDRSLDWLKVKPKPKTAICNVEGWTEGKNSRSSTFGSLVLSQNGEYVGRAGGGITDINLRKINAVLKNSPRKPKPFQIDKPYTAVETDLKVQVKYFRRTEKGKFRFPRFDKIVDSSVTAFSLKAFTQR